MGDKFSRMHAGDIRLRLVVPSSDAPAEAPSYEASMLKEDGKFKVLGETTLPSQVMQWLQKVIDGR